MRNPEKMREEIGGQDEAGAEEFIVKIPHQSCEREKINQTRSEEEEVKGEKFVEEIEKEPEYQSIDDIIFREVKGGDSDFNTATVLNIEPNQPEEEIRKKLAGQISEENWWLQKYWQEKGPPNEQLELTVGDNKLSIYNFGEKITDRHLVELERVVKEFFQIEEGKIFDNVRYILIDNERKINLEKNLEEEQNGEAPSGDKAIKLYPRGVQLGFHRIEGASNFEGTLIHEFSHLIPDIKLSFYDAWREKFRWQLKGTTEVGTKRYGKWECESPENCVSKYANYAPEEDICESMVAALRNPGILDPKRLKFLRENLLTGSNQKETPEIKLERLVNNEVKLPTIESPANFKIRSPEQESEFRRVIPKVYDIYIPSLLAEEELQALREKEDRAYNVFFTGGSLENLQMDLKNIESIGKIEVFNLNILAEALHRLNLDQDSIKKIIEYKKNDAEEAKNFALRTKFIIQLLKTKENEARLTVSTSIDLPEKEDEERLRKALMEYFNFKKNSVR